MMKTEFLDEGTAAHLEAQQHIHDVYAKCYGARVTRFAPRLVTTRNQQGQILCAAGLRTAQEGFFSEIYMDGGFSGALKTPEGEAIPLGQVMEVVSLASTTPFPVLSMLDVMIGWGRQRGMTCGVFTATAHLRRLLKRTGLAYTAVCPADPSRVDNPAEWGSYYDQDPWVCVCSDREVAPIILSPRTRAAVASELRSEAS